MFYRESVKLRSSDVAGSKQRYHAKPGQLFAARRRGLQGWKLWKHGLGYRETGLDIRGDDGEAVFVQLFNDREHENLAWRTQERPR